MAGFSSSVAGRDAALPDATSHVTRRDGEESSEEFFKECFLEFLKVRFNNDALLIAYTFSITERAAENWVHGLSLPNAYRLWLILTTQPEALHCMRLAVDNPPPPVERAVDKLRRRA